MGYLCAADKTVFGAGIVVVENVERIMRDEGLPAREATEKSMGEISGALERMRSESATHAH